MGTETSPRRPWATLILAAGRGTRMGEGDHPKVCQALLGTPVIIRALETYNLGGARFNVVVVGHRAPEVMATISRRFPDTVFAFQDQPLGTGHAARIGAAVLERLRHEGDLLVVAGDKVIEPEVVQQLLARHRQSDADLTIATAPRPPHSSGGIILQTASGQITGILELAELRRLQVLARLQSRFQRAARLDGAEIDSIVRAGLDEKHALRLIEWLELTSNPDQGLSRQQFHSRVPEADRSGWLRAGSRSVPVEQALEIFNQVNLSTYVFRAPALLAALDHLKPRLSRQEEYLTDTIEILMRDAPPARIIGFPVPDPRGLMAFNCPAELHAIEQVCRERESEETALTAEGHGLARAEEWIAMLAKPSANARRMLRRWYGAHPAQSLYTKVLAAFAQRFGPESRTAVFRSPGRINLLGRHIDHQGGSVNVLAINREIILAAAPRTDDLVRLVNVDGAQFAEHHFRLSDLVASVDWEDWHRVIDGPRLHRLLDRARGDWVNYTKASILRLQELFRHRRLRGFDAVVGGEIPMGAGLSSSSALVVAAAEATIAFNQLPVSARRLVSLCGEGEWFVGTRGGAADHAAIKLSRRGYVTRVGFFPFRLEAAAPFLPDHDLVVCNSGVYAGKSAQARHRFNAQVAAYHLGRVWCRLHHPEIADPIAHLRDLDPVRLGLPEPVFLRMLAGLPARLNRSQALQLARQAPSPDRERLERLLESHSAPPNGYAVRDVVLFGLSEMDRARRCIDLLRRNDAAGLGRLMSLSHEGDRVSRTDADGRSRRFHPQDAARALTDLADRKSPEADLAGLPGSYACSLPEMDRMVDLALRQPGVQGAQLAGAGLGGCIMILVQAPHTAGLVRAFARQGIQADVFRPIAGASRLLLV